MYKYINKKWLMLLALIIVGDHAYSSNDWKTRLSQRVKVAEDNLAQRIARDTAREIQQQEDVFQRMDDDLFFERGVRSIQRSIDDAKRRVANSQNQMDRDVEKLQDILDDMNGQLVDIMRVKESMHDQSQARQKDIELNLHRLQLNFSNTVTRLALVGAHG